MILPSTTHPDFWSGVCLGIIAGCLLSALIACVLAAFLMLKNDMYDVDHWKLNVKVPFTTMWMNMGYWTSPSGHPIHDFDQACSALLHQVVAASGILDPGETTTTTTTRSKLAILDLGIGCGDQSLELSRLIHQSKWHEYRYVGLTLNATQFRLASSRLLHERHHKPDNDGDDDDDDNDDDEQEVTTSQKRPTKLLLFQADAANPANWPPATKSAVESLATTKNDHHATATAAFERWVLGLDSLYHFFPSRQPIFHYASTHLDANLMAFDLLLNDDASVTARLVVRLVSAAMQCPVNTFVTEAAYVSQLTDAGYDARLVEVRDVTDHVFPGLVQHVTRQAAVLRPYGIALGKYKATGKLFAWFARSRALRAVIVVARKKAKTT